ncbi:hypothetical protein Y027_5161 [Burkholderia pseudomallei TSV5]|nr:hypothetical protein Y027_5161 [Burkholderia pseudomallei TSV5]
MPQAWLAMAGARRHDVRPSAEPSVSFGPFSLPQIPRNPARGQTGQGRTIC